MHKSNIEIIIVNDFADVNGGAGQVALSSAIALADKGYSVTVFTAVPPIMLALNRHNLKIICTNQYEILRDPKRLRAALQGVWNFKAMRSMARLLDVLDPSNTIVHIHSWSKALSSSVAHIAIKNKYNVICTMHDYFLGCPNGGFFNYKENKICQIPALSGQCLVINCDVRSYPQKLWRIGRQVIQKSLGSMPKGIKHFIAVSDFSKRVLEAYLPKGANMYLIPNPIDVSKSSPAKIRINNAFVYVGRLSKEKGPHLFAQAASILGLKSVFVGDGPMRTHISHIYPSSIFTGWLPHAEVIEIVKSARALIFPSLLYETQGLVVLEAAAMGVPVIVPDTSAASESVVDGVTGLWFKSGVPEDLVRKMRILQDPEIAEQMGRAAYERYWADPLTMEQHMLILERCYQDVLSK